MSKLYHNEKGHVVPTLCEELASYRIARKVLHLPKTQESATLYLLARPYPDADLPLRVSVNGNEVPGPLSDGEHNYHWFQVDLPPSLLRPGANTLEFWTDSHALNSWSLALEAGHRDPTSWISTDGGRTWRNHGMGYMNVCLGEYVVRLRLAEGADPTPPPMQWESPDQPRLKRLYDLLPDGVREPGPTLDRVRALASWVCTSWEYRCEGGSYAPWDAETIIAWGVAGLGHDGRPPVVMCVHYGVTLVSFCLAAGIPARCAVLTGDINRNAGHFVTEIWMPEFAKWVMVDPTLDAILFQGDIPLSISEIQAAGEDLSDLIRWGPGYHYQIKHPVVGPWIDRTFANGVCFRHRSIWPRTDLLSRPELGPAWHGDTAYCETSLVWEERDLENGFGMFPYFGSTSYFDAPPRGFPGGCHE